MRAFEFSRCALSISLAAALLAACGGSSIPIRATDSASSDATPLTHSKTFDYTGAKQTFIVPAGVRRLTVSAHGGVGGGASDVRAHGDTLQNRIIVARAAAGPALPSTRTARATEARAVVRPAVREAAVVREIPAEAERAAPRVKAARVEPAELAVKAGTANPALTVR